MKKAERTNSSAKMALRWKHQLGLLYLAVVLATITTLARCEQGKDLVDSFNVSESSSHPTSSHNNSNNGNRSLSNSVDMLPNTATPPMDISVRGDVTTMQSVNSTPKPLRHCQFQIQQQDRDSLYSVAARYIPRLDRVFFIDMAETRCYLTRSDMEVHLKSNSTELFVVFFTIGCLNPAGADVVFLEDEEAEELENGTFSLFNGTDNSVVNEGLGAMGNITSGESGSSGARATSTSRVSGSSTSFSRGATANLSSTEGRLHGLRSYYDNVVTYFQPTNCRINLKGPYMLANMSELRVLNVIGARAWDLSELPREPQLCRAFDNVVALTIFNDFNVTNYIHHLAVCKENLEQVVEVTFNNNSMTSFPEVLHTIMPNLRSLEIAYNNLTEPPSFPWPSGFARLPRNLSRTYQFNLHYNFKNAFDMEPYLFRRTFLLERNNIRNITHFQFTSDFQYISLQQNQLSDIAEDVFDLIPDIQFINLAHNELKSLPERLFSRLLRLRRLDLQNNNLTNLPVGLFANQRKLETLNLEDNLIERLEPGVFARLEGLKELKLKNNRLTEIPRGVFSTLSVKLHTVDLQHNPLCRFPASLLLMRGLSQANLDYTNITQLDFVDMFLSGEISASDLVDAVKNPTTGSLSFRDDPTYQKVISLQHSRLRTIRWYNASREILGTFVLVLKHFTFKTDHSRLACDCHILNVTHGLRELRDQGLLSGKEACFSGWSCKWPSELEAKPLADLKDEETYCPLSEAKLDQASGRENMSLACPQNCTCFVRTKLKTVIVDCRNTGLIELPATVPEETRELWLQNNSITMLKKLDYLKGLHDLKLTANLVQELPMEVLLSMVDLRELHVDHNLLTTLLPDFVSLQHLRGVRLSGNPFRCDCRLLWMKEWALQHQALVKDLTEIKCSVEDSDGQSFISVPDSDFICLVLASLSELAVPIATPLTMAVILLILAVVTFLYRRRLKVFLYIHTGLHPFDRDSSDVPTRYDATVVCDVTARSWVLRHVVETLEREGGYRVFFYHRDALVGQPTSDNVRHCVQHSRRLVLVLVKGWRDNHLLLTTARQSLAKCRADMVGFLALLIYQSSPEDVVEDMADKKRDLRAKLGGKGDGKMSSSADSMDEDLRQMIRRGRFVSSDDKYMAKKLLYEMPHLKKPSGAIKGKDETKLYKAGKNHCLLMSCGWTGSEASLQPVPLHDIVAIAKKEEGAWMDKNMVSLSNSHLNSPVDLEPKSLTAKRQGSESPSESAELRYDDIRLEKRSLCNGDYVEKLEENEEKEQEDTTGENPDAETDATHKSAQGDAAKNQPQMILQNQLSVESRLSAQPRWIFVWYAAPDLAFTLKNMVEPLERRGHSCVLQDRDFAVGAAIQENIVEAAERCSRCVLVLSNHLARDEWFTFVFHVVFERQQQQDRDAHRVALVTRESLDVALFVEEVRQVIRTTEVLDEHDPWFAKRLGQFVTMDGNETG